MIFEIIIIILAICIMFQNFIILYKLNKKMKEQTIKSNEYKVKRKHSSVLNANFGNILNGRTNYDKYKNKDGLYEPVKPKKGIPLKEGV